MKESKTLVCATAARLAEEGFLGDGSSLSIREGSSMLITSPGADFRNLKEEDILIISLDSGREADGVDAPEQLRHLAVYRSREDINALIHAVSPSILCCSKSKETVKPLLDDMAQLIGTSIRAAAAEVSGKSLKALCGALKKRNAVFIDGEGALCGAGTLDDAHAVCQVGEKACQAWIESYILGGGHIISAIESALMRFVYLKKYSRQSEKNR